MCCSGEQNASRVRVRSFLQFLQIAAAGLRPAVTDVTPFGVLASDGWGGSGA